MRPFQGQGAGSTPADATHWDLAELESLRRRYDYAMQATGFAHSFWQTHGQTIDLGNFRGQFHYLGQHEGPTEYSDFYERPLARPGWGLLDLFDEDGAFGALRFMIDGKWLSRDLLDSVDEINFLRTALRWNQRKYIQVLDIGAGYGRFAHRLTAAMPNAHVWATDAVAESTWLAQGYLAYRGATRAHVLPFDGLHTIGFKQFNLAVAIHVWPECTSAAVQWWLDYIHMRHVPYLLFIGLTTSTTDGIDIDAMIKAYDYEVKAFTSSGMFKTPCVLYSLP